MKKVVVKCRKMLSMLLVISMLASMALSTAVFADEQSNGTGTTTNGAYDASGNWAPANNGEGLNYVVAEGTTDATEITLNKTAEPLGNDTFKITLRVETHLKKIMHTNSGAVVLVIDTSQSMNNSRITAAKTAAKEFLKTYAGTDETATRMISIVSFNSSGQVNQDWVNVAGGAGKNSYDAVVSKIDGLRNSTGTNMESGLSVAASQLGKGAVSNITAKSVVLLSDGAPTRSSSSSSGGFWSNNKAHCQNAVTQANVVKNAGAELYTVCYGASSETAYDRVTVSDFLKNEIASSAAGKTYAYDADHSTDLVNAFKAISEAIVSGLTGEGWHVNDPMNAHVYIRQSDNTFSTTANEEIDWELKTAEVVEKENNMVYYIYEYSYVVAVNFGEIAGYNEGDYYPTNLPTYLTVGEETFAFPVPGVKGTFFDISGSKIWNDAENQDGIRPESITINLLADGTQIDSKTVSEADGWAWTFTDLAKYKNGAEIQYTLTENAVPGYTPEVNGYNVTNTHVPEVVTVTGAKTWNDNDDQDGKRPESITINLLADGEKVDSKTVTADDGWAWTFENLPKFSGGKEIVYTITEETVDGYTSKVDGYNVTNTHIPEVVEVAGNKTWEDKNDQDGIRPDSITINLLANGKKVQSVVVDATANWAWSFKNLAKYAAGVEIEYTITEEEVAGYETTVDGYDVTNTHKVAKTEVTVKKVWEDADNQDGLRAKSVVIKLKANGEDTGKTITLTEANGWTGTFTDLDKNKAGNEIKYTIEEVAIEGYTSEITGDMNVGYTVTNTHKVTKTEVSVKKVWKDTDNQDGLRAKSVEIKLKANGEDTGKAITLTEANGWTGTFTDLDKNKAGNEIKYTIEEVAIEGYTSEITGDMSVGYTVTNTHEVAKTKVSVKKDWVDATNQDKVRPESITVTLYADKVATEKTLTLNKANGWTGTFEDLDVYKAGEPIEYTVDENEVVGYTKDIKLTAETDEGIEYTLTNTHEVEKISVSGQKTWNDNNDQDDKRPDKIVIRLYKNNEEIDSQEVTAENGWKWEFTDLEKYTAGQVGVVAKYTISEDAVDGYTSEVSGYNVTNTHNPEKVNVSVKKVWIDANDQDGLQDDSVVIKLKADNEETGKTITLTEAGNWTGTFEGLDKYKAGTVIQYTIEEVAIEGYESVITGDMNVGYTVTNTHTPETITLTGSKTWVDNNDQDGIRPESITIRLLADGNEVRNQEVAIAEDGSAAWKFEDLPKYRDHGTEIVYAITEDAVSEYTPTVDGMNVTNTHTPYETSVTVSKVWADNNDQDGLQPEDVTINLLADGNIVATQILNEGNNWQHTFTELPVNANGKAIVYTVEEVEIEGYTATYTGDAETGYTVTNTHTPETITLTGSKEWDDNNNQDGKRPESITIRLLADGEQQEVYVASEENEWSWEFDNLPKYRDHGTEIIYTITEDVVKDYTAEIDGMNVTNTHTPEKTTVTVSKVWKDANDQDGIRPEKITVFLHADEYETDKSVVLSEENNWTAIFNDLPVYAAGQEIEYYVTEAEVEGYESVVTGDATIGYTITNIHEPATVEVAGTKTWKDNNNQDGKRPESITVNLIANGEKIDSVEVTEADGWAYKFENLPKFEAGEEIAYAVTENAVEGYTVTVDGYNLTNSYTPELTSVTVTKNWQDTNDKDGIRPDSITVRLLANGKDTGLVMKLTAEYKWVGMFAELPAYENGKKIEYTVTEDAVKDYNTVITGSAEKGFEITNSHTSVPKTGDDNNITLYASVAGVSVVALLAMAVILKKKKSEEI